MNILNQKKKKVNETSVSNIHIFSYKMFNDYLKPIYPKLPSLEKAIKQSMTPIPFEVYVSSMFFLSFIAGIIGGVLGFIASQYINIQPVSISYFIPMVSGMMLMGITFGIIHSIPALRVKTRETKLVEEIPHFIG